jgi:hypothetical protein
LKPGKAKLWIVNKHRGQQSSTLQPTSIAAAAWYGSPFSISVTSMMLVKNLITAVT